jgi:hypothetical protein
MSFYVRFKSTPDRWVRYSSEKEFEDRKRWGHVLDVQTEDPDHDNSRELPKTTEAVNGTGEPERVGTLEEFEPQKKRVRRKASPDEESEGKEQ